MSRHVFNAAALRPQTATGAGSRTEITADLFPILSGMSLYTLRLAPQGIREPHWHPNAHELSYCVSGRVAITVCADGAVTESFQLAPGDLAFVPRGYLHHIENLGDEAFLLVAFTHERPEDLGISSSISSMPPEINAASVGGAAPLFSNLPHRTQDVVLATRTGLPPDPPKQSQYKLELGRTDPAISDTAGAISVATNSNFPILRGITMYDLRMKPEGFREPHWHPNAAEMDYVVSGEARMTILSPGGDKDTFIVREGDMVFIPPAYYHDIENTSAGATHFAVFFNDPSPQDIGISGALGAFSKEVLAAAFGIDPSALADMPQPRQNVFLASTE